MSGRRSGKSRSGAWVSRRGRNAGPAGSRTRGLDPPGPHVIMGRLISPALHRRAIRACTRFARLGGLLGAVVGFAALGPSVVVAADGSAISSDTGAALLRSAPSGVAVDPNPPIEGRVDPATYRVGPGDEFALRYSDLLDPKILRVGPAGDLLLPDAGSIPVAGLTLFETQERVHDRLRPFLRGKGFALSLQRPRRFRLQVLGEVEQPGAVTLQAPARASEAVAAAGGVAAGGARRGIQVRRGTDTLLVDLVRAARAGDPAADPLVFESDAIFVPARGRWVDVLGAFSHPERYEFVRGDRIADLVTISGGIAPDAAIAEASLERIDEAGFRERSPVRLDRAMASPGGPDDVELHEGDRLYVPRRAHWREGHTVFVEGEVARPGPYALEEGVDRVRTLLGRAGGYTAEADSLGLRVERPWEAAPRDTAFLRLARDRDAMLSPADREYLVMSWRERRAISADVGALLARGDERGDISLMDGDRIVAPRRFALISVQGEVKAPGYVPFVEGRSAGDYVDAAGGYTSRADRSRARVTLALTGRQVGAREAGRLRAGDVIWVPAKAEKSTWASVRDFLTTASQIATIYLVVREATK